MLRQAGKSAGFVYLFGTWVYGALFLWGHQLDFSDFATLAGHTFLRALVWPMWVILDLI